MNTTIEQILGFWAIVFGLSLLACGEDEWIPPSWAPSDSSGEECSIDNPCSNPDEFCWVPNDSWEYVNNERHEQSCGIEKEYRHENDGWVYEGKEKYTGHCVLPATDQAVENASHNTVCGCDGKTYANSMEARKAGVSVAGDGACPRPTKDECGAGHTSCGGEEICFYDASANCGTDGSGRCQYKPMWCPVEKEPVCGCDGVTYRNRCQAHKNGISVEKMGECGSSTTNSFSYGSPDEAKQSSSDEKNSKNLGDSGATQPRGRPVPGVWME